MNQHRAALRDFQDAADDLSRASYATFENALRRFAAAIDPNTPLGEVAAKLPAVDFEAWYQVQLRSVGGFVGSGTLDWPVNRDERLSLQVAMIRRIASGQLDVLDVTVNFFFVRNDFNDNVAEFTEQVVRPFIRDILRQAHDDPEFKRALFADERPEVDAVDEENHAEVKGPIRRIASWLEEETHRHGKLWAVIFAIITIVLGLLSL